MSEKPYRLTYDKVADLYEVIGPGGQWQARGREATRSNLVQMCEMFNDAYDHGFREGLQHRQGLITNE